MPTDFVEKHEYFSVLKQLGVTFYNTERNVKHIKKEMPKKPSAITIKFSNLLANQGTVDYDDISMLS